MSTVVLASIFRNSKSYLDRFFNQIEGLDRALRDQDKCLQLVLTEGDSTDGTYEQLWHELRERNLWQRAKLLKVDHGGPTFGSVDVAERWCNISKVCNATLESLPDADTVVYVESDLLWPVETMLSLIRTARYSHIDAVAPMCTHLPTGAFYDTWGHRANGTRFQPNPPYHPVLNQRDPGHQGLVPIESAGSCIVMDGIVAKHARFTPPELGIVGFCQDIATHGFKLWLDPTLSVFHP